MDFEYARRLKKLLGRAQLSALTAYAKLSAQGLSARSVLQIHATLHRALEQLARRENAVVGVSTQSLQLGLDF